MATQFTDRAGNHVATRRWDGRETILELEVDDRTWKSLSVVLDDDCGIVVWRRELEQACRVVSMTVSRMNERARELELWLSSHSGDEWAVPRGFMAAETEAARLEARGLVRRSLSVVR